MSETQDCMHMECVGVESCKFIKPERTVLSWENYSCNRLPAARTKQGKGWNVRIDGSGTIENPTYSLSVGNILIIQQDIPTLEDAKQMAQDLQDVLDGYTPVFKFNWNLNNN